MLEERPGAFIFMGNGDSAGLHHPAYEFNDDGHSGRRDLLGEPRRDRHAAAGVTALRDWRAVLAESSDERYRLPGDRGRRRRPRDGARARARRARGRHRRGGRRHRHPDLGPQQRGHPCRHLLSAGLAQGTGLRRGQASALRLSPRARPAAQGLRQADRRDIGEPEAGAGDDHGAGQGLGRRYAALARCRRGAGDGAGGALRDRPALARDRRRRQPRADAVAARRMRGGRRLARAQHADRRLAMRGGGLQRRFRR